MGSVLRVGHSQNFEPNFQPLQLATASQIVSHILRMWRLNKQLSVDTKQSFHFLPLQNLSSHRRKTRQIYFQNVIEIQ